MLVQDERGFASIQKVGERLFNYIGGVACRGWRRGQVLLPHPMESGGSELIVFFFFLDTSDLLAQVEIGRYGTRMYEHVCTLHRTAVGSLAPT